MFFCLPSLMRGFNSFLRFGGKYGCTEGTRGASIQSLALVLSCCEFMFSSLLHTQPSTRPLSAGFFLPNNPRGTPGFAETWTRFDSYKAQEGKSWKTEHSGSELLARPERFELPTPWFEAKCSIQMSYGRNDGKPSEGASHEMGLYSSSKQN